MITDKLMIESLAETLKQFGQYNYRDNPCDNIGESYFSAFADEIQKMPHNDVEQLFLDFLSYNKPIVEQEDREFFLQIISGYFTDQALLDKLNSNKNLDECHLDTTARSAPFVDPVDELFKSFGKKIDYF